MSERLFYYSTTRTAPWAAEVVSTAYAFSAVVTLRLRGFDGFQPCAFHDAASAMLRLK